MSEGGRPVDPGIGRALFGVMLTWVLVTVGPYLLGLWIVNARGVSATAATSPYWDFSNLWAGSKLARMGEIDALFDVTLYRERLSQLLGMPMTNREWSYPPSILLIGVPLSLLPIAVAHSLWTAATIGGFVASLSLLRLPRAATILAALSPAMAFNMLLGQNGALTGALLIAGLVLAPRRPWLGGMLIGLLCIKPHIALLVPVAFVAARNWRAMFSAGLTVAAIVIVTSLLFGLESWVRFFVDTRAIMTGILEAPYPAPHQINGISVFLMVRSLGGGLGFAYGVQGIAILAGAAVVARLWWLNEQPSLAVVAATLILSGVVLPYGYTYDLPAFSAAALAMAGTGRGGRAAGVAAWMAVGAVTWVFRLAHLSLFPLAALPLVAVAWRRALASPR